MEGSGENQQRQKVRWAEPRAIHERDSASCHLPGELRGVLHFLHCHSLTPHVKCCLAGPESPQTQCLMVWSHGSHMVTIPGTYQDARFPKEKQVLGVNHPVHTNSLGTVSHTYQLGNGGTPLQIQVFRPHPKASHSSRIFRGSQSWPCCMKSFLLGCSRPGLICCVVLNFYFDLNVYFIFSFFG